MRDCPPAGARRAGTCPVRKPAPSGPHGITPSPAARQNGRISTSIERSTSEYCGCSDTNGAQPSRSWSRDRPGEQPGGEVRDAERAHLARADEAVERLERLLQRHVRVGRVDLVEVDHVDAHAPQARVAGLDDAVGRQALRRRGRRPAKRTFVASTTSSRWRASHGASVSSERAVDVHVGGVDEGPARLEEAVEHAVGLVARRLAAHQHRAEAQPADGERARASSSPSAVPTRSSSSAHSGRRIGSAESQTGRGSDVPTCSRPASAMAVALAVPSAADAATKTVQAGPFGEGQPGVVPGAVRRRQRVTTASTVTIHRGDKVRWKINGFHSVTFSPEGADPPGLISPDPASPVSGAADAAGAPFWFNGQPNFNLNPLAAFAAGRQEARPGRAAPAPASRSPRRRRSPTR